jgi:large subunit ribosomal protein L4
MPTVDVLNLKRDKVGSLNLSDDVFGAEVANHLMHEVVTAQHASQRAGTSAAKERAAVRGSSRKIYRQKGTGRARHGSIRAPLFVGGGRAHPPKPQDWARRPPRRVRLAALKSALSLRLKEGKLLVVENFELAEVKTKVLAGILKAFDVRKVLLVDGRANANLKLSVRNLPKSQFLPPEGLNVYDILHHDHLILSKDAVRELELRLGSPGAQGDAQ